MSKGNLFIVTGPSGAGKGTVLGRVMPSMEDLHYSVSATTRAPREGEEDGVNYYFLRKEQFLEMIGQGAFWNMPNMWATTTARRQARWTSA